jgi:hypothetical protein
MRCSGVLRAARNPFYFKARLTFDAGKLGCAHCPAELAVSSPASGQQAYSRAAGELELGADDRMDPLRFRGLDQLDGSIEPVAIAETERGDPEASGRLDHALR